MDNLTDNEKINKNRKNRKTQIIQLRKVLIILRIFLLIANFLAILFVITYTFKSLYFDLLFSFYGPPLYERTYPYQNFKDNSALILVFIIPFFVVMIALYVFFKVKIKKLPKIYHSFITKERSNKELFGVSIGLLLAATIHIEIILIYYIFILIGDFAIIIYISMILVAHSFLLLLLYYSVYEQKYDKIYVKRVYMGLIIYLILIIIRPIIYFFKIIYLYNISDFSFVDLSKYFLKI